MIATLSTSSSSAAASAAPQSPSAISNASARDHGDVLGLRPRVVHQHGVQERLLAGGVEVVRARGDGGAHHRLAEIDERADAVDQHAGAPRQRVERGTVGDARDQPFRRRRAAPPARRACRRRARRAAAAARAAAARGRSGARCTRSRRRRRSAHHSFARSAHIVRVRVRQLPFGVRRLAAALGGLGGAVRIRQSDHPRPPQSGGKPPHSKEAARGDFTLQRCAAHLSNAADDAPAPARRAVRAVPGAARPARRWSARRCARAPTPRARSRSSWRCAPRRPRTALAPCRSAAPRSRGCARAVLGALAPGEVEVGACLCDRCPASPPGSPLPVSNALAANPDVVRVDLDPIGGGAGADRRRAHPRRSRAGARRDRRRHDHRGDRHRRRGGSSRHRRRAGARGVLLPRRPRSAIGDRSNCCPDGTAHAVGPRQRRLGRPARRRTSPASRCRAAASLPPASRRARCWWRCACSTSTTRASSPTGSRRSTGSLAERPDVRVVNMSLVSSPALSRRLRTQLRRRRGCAANLLLGRGHRAALAARHAGVRRRPATTGALDADERRRPAWRRAVAVGAVDAHGRGRARSATPASELDLLAPGVDIVSDGLGGQRDVMSGTSMASPHAAGAAALMLSARPGFGAAEVERMLLRDRRAPSPIRRTRRATPRVDAFAALARGDARRRARARGGGSRATDCLLEWNFVPPEIVRRRGWPLAECRDNDPLCDADRRARPLHVRLLAVLQHARPAAARLCRWTSRCAASPCRRRRSTRRPASLDRINVDYLASALPDFPFAGSDTCGARDPVHRRAPARRRAPAVGHLRVSVVDRDAPRLRPP